MLKIIYKGTTVQEVMNDTVMAEDMDSRLREVEEANNLPACKRFAQRGENVHCWIEVNDVQLQTIKSAQTNFLRQV